MYYSVQDGGLTTAASVMAIYGSLVFLSSVIGGRDRILEAVRLSFIGILITGHIALATPFGQVASLSFYCLDYLWN